MNGEGCSHTHLALDFDATIVSLDDLFADGESQPCAAGLALMFAHPVEFFEEMGNGFIRDAHTRILDRRWIFSSVSKAAADDHRSIRTVVFDGITQQVEQDLFDLVAVGFHERHVVGDIHADLDVRLLRLGHHHIAAFIDQVCHAEARLAELHPARFQACQVKEGGSQRVQSQRFIVDVVDDLVTLLARHLRAQQQVGGCAERSQRGAQFMDELRDQVRLLEQTCILDGDRRLRAQHATAWIHPGR